MKKDKRNMFIRKNLNKDLSLYCVFQKEEEERKLDGSLECKLQRLEKKKE